MSKVKVSELFKHIAVKAYIQHGFIPIGDNETQIYGSCPFCGTKKHKNSSIFYVNKKNKNWDCKSCGREGGFDTFLSKMARYVIKNFKGGTAVKLAKYKKLKLTTLRKFEIGYSPVTGKYIIPVRDTSGRIKNLQIYDMQKLMSTFSCKNILSGMEKLIDDPQIIFLTEGFWDNLAMYEIMQKVVIDKSYEILSVPGAKTFKEDWIGLFSGKTVIVLYDNDKAGQSGAVKVFNLLSSVTGSLFFIRWKTEYKDGFDIRDLYIQNSFDGGKTYIAIQNMLHNYPKDIDEEVQAIEKKNQ